MQKGDLKICDQRDKLTFVHSKILTAYTVQRKKKGDFMKCSTMKLIEGSVLDKYKK